MKTISPRDASCLAMAGQYPKMRPDIAAKYLELIEDPEAKLVFQALMKDESDWGEYSEEVVKAARALLAWAKKNRELSEELYRRPCSHCGRSAADVRRARSTRG